MSPLAPPRRILLCVGIGLLLNAAVTAACWLTQPQILLRQDSASYLHISGANRSAWSVSRTDYLLHGRRWSARGRPTEVNNPPPRPDGEMAVAMSGFQYQFGFPFRSVQFRDAAAEHYLHRNGHPMFVYHQDTTHTLPLYQRGLPTGLTSTRHQLLPLDPLPIGFLLNTLIYASLPALIMTAFHLRTQRRRRQSRCPACGYPIAGLPTCPECGRAAQIARLPRPKRAAERSNG